MNIMNIPTPSEVKERLNPTRDAKFHLNEIIKKLNTTNKLPIEYVFNDETCIDDVKVQLEYAGWKVMKRRINLGTDSFTSYFGPGIVIDFLK